MTLPDTELQLAFRETDPRIFQLLLRVREDILTFLPDHVEKLRWGCIAFDKPEAKATVKDNICYLRARPNHLEIGFGLGVFLKDPQGLLKGNGRYKRNIILKTPDDFRRDPIQALILQSYHFDSNRTLYKLLPNDDYQALRKGI